MTLLLRILVALLMVQALVKFGVFFAVGYKTRRKMLDAQYGARTTATKQSDLLLLGLVVTLLGLLLGTGEVEYLSFAVGLWCGMTLIQTYFHEFSTPLAPEHRPADAEKSPIKLMSYAIQADPARPWKELVIIATLAVWVLYRTVAG